MTKIILTATLDKFGVSINATRNWNLCKRINANQLEFYSATGYYKGRDQGDVFVVMCPHPANVACALAIARGFSQESVIVESPEGAELVYVSGPRDGERHKAIGCISGEEAKRQDNYTQVKHNGHSFSYVFGPGAF